MGDSLILILLLALVFLGALAWCFSLFWKGNEPEVPVSEECCGAHDVCEKDSLLSSSSAIEYYEDEELDRFVGKTALEYSEEEEEEFREVLLTLQEEETAGWLKSLQLREIVMPQAVKDEALLIISEIRASGALR